MTERSYVHVDPATGVAARDDLGSGSDGSGDNALLDDGTWGPAGGTPGAPGAPGAAGLGPIFLPGEDGEDGLMGPPGLSQPGTAGATGATGPSGAGPIFLPGEDGEEGLMGPPGVPGVNSVSSVIIGRAVGALLGSDQTQSGLNGDTIKTFNLVTKDTDGFAGSNRLTIPAGKGGDYLVGGVVYLTNVDANKYIGARIYKNGVSIQTVRWVPASGGDTNFLVPIEVPAFDCVPGDYFELVGSTDDTSWSLSTSGAVPNFWISLMDPGGAGRPSPRQTALPNAIGGGTTVTHTFPRTPLTDSVFFILSSMVVATVQAISSISQTNVTWTSIHGASNGTSDKVELWVGVGNGGTPGTVATVTYAGTITNVATWAMEWPAKYLGTTPVLDQSADATGTGTNQSTGVIVPTTAANLAFVLAGVANGGIELRLRSPYPFVEVAVLGGFFGVFGYLWGSTGSLVALIPSQSSAAWVNSIISVK